MTPEAKRAIANAHRAAIRSGAIECRPECRHGFPDIWHHPSCYWIQAIEAIYKLERELELTEKDS